MAGAVTDPIRLAIVDDHPVVREGTAALLAAQPDIALAGRPARSRRPKVARHRRGRCRPARHPARDGQRPSLLTGDDADRGPAIVVLSAYDYPQYAEAAMRLGAAGFVLKTAPLAELLDAIRRAAAGGMAFGVRPGQRTAAPLGA